MPTVTLFGYLCRDKNDLPDGTHAENVGGKGLFTGAALSRTGVATKLVTWLPNEDHELLDALHGYPLSTFIIPMPTGTVNTNVHRGDTTVATTRIDPMAIEPKHLTKDMLAALANSDIIHLSPDIDGKISLETFAFLHERFGEKLSLDAGKYYRTLEPDGQLVPRDEWPDKERYLHHVHTLFLSQEDIAVLVKSGRSFESIGKDLSALGPKEVVITRGSKGSFIFDAVTHRSVEIPAFPPRTFLDPTGAGDTFLGAYLGYRALGHDCEQSGRFAAMAASAKLNYSGPLRETVSDIEAMLDAA